MTKCDWCGKHFFGRPNGPLICPECWHEYVAGIEAERARQNAIRRAETASLEANAGREV